MSSGDREIPSHAGGHPQTPEDEHEADEGPDSENTPEPQTPGAIVALVGRPNVGKSTLFNRLVGRRVAIVHDEPGVTRDRHYGDVFSRGRRYTLVDTGGFDPESDDPMGQGIRRQVELAIAEADVIICVLDATASTAPADHAEVALLRRADKPVIFVANKADNPRLEAESADLYRLGLKGLNINSDPHLFRRPYGLARDPAQVAALLEEYGLTGKVALLPDGSWDGVALSGGQRKPLAMVSLLLAAPPIVILDEWAADQDPAFRRRFYEHILPELRTRQCAALCATHDSRYFAVVDQCYILRDGRLMPSTQDGPPRSPEAAA